MASKKEKPSLINDLLQRRVPQIIGIYMGVSWGIIQFVNWLVDEFTLSYYLPQFTFIFSLCMLPTIILLAYFHGKPGKDKWTSVEKIGVPVNIAATIIILFLVFGGKELGATQKTVTVQDETGNTIERTIIKNQFRKNIAIFNFSNNSTDSSLHWLQTGLSHLISFDLSQDMYISTNSIFSFLEDIRETNFSSREKLPLTLMLKMARESHLNYLVTGNFQKTQDQFNLNTILYEVNNAKKISEHSYTGTDLFEIIDRITIQLKKDLRLPGKHMETVQDLPVSAISTSSFGALNKYVQGLNARYIQNNYSRSIQYHQQATAIDPNFTVAWIELSSTYAQSSQFNKYNQTMENVIHRIYQLPERYQFMIKALYYRLSEQLEKNLSVLKMWAELYPEDIMAHRELYRYYSDVSNQIPLAISEVKNILKIDPSLLSYLQVLGNLYQLTGDYEQAHHYYNQYAEHFPNSSESYLSLGRLHETKGEFKQARHYYEKAQLIEPGKSLIVIELGDIERKQGNFREAEKLYNKALELSPSPEQHARVYSRMKNLYGYQGKINQALTYLDSAMQEKEKYLDPLNLVFEKLSDFGLYFSIGQKQTAWKLIENAHFEPPFDNALAIFKMHYYLELNDLPNSERVMKEVESFIRNFGISEFERQMIFAKGRIREIKKDYEEALKIYEEYLEQDPSSVNTMIRMGVCCRQLKRYDKAIDIMEQALIIMPVHAESRYELALVYAEAGNITKAVDYLNQALEIWKDADPEFIPAQKARKKLADLQPVL